MTTESILFTPAYYRLPCMQVLLIAHFYVVAVENIIDFNNLLYRCLYVWEYKTHYFRIMQNETYPTVTVGIRFYNSVTYYDLVFDNPRCTDI